MAMISTDKGSDIPPMPPTVDLLGRDDDKRELLGWCLVSGFLCTLWFPIVSYISYKLNVLVCLAKLALYDPYSPDLVISRPSITRKVIEIPTMNQSNPQKNQEDP